MDSIKGTILLRNMNRGSKSKGKIAFLISEDMDIYRIYRSGHDAINDPFFYNFDKQEVEIEGEIQENRYLMVETIAPINSYNTEYE